MRLRRRRRLRRGGQLLGRLGGLASPSRVAGQGTRTAAAAATPGCSSVSVCVRVCSVVAAAAAAAAAATVALPPVCNGQPSSSSAAARRLSVRPSVSSPIQSLLFQEWKTGRASEGERERSSTNAVFVCM